jgi:hypothetical protein
VGCSIQEPVRQMICIDSKRLDSLIATSGSCQSRVVILYMMTGVCDLIAMRNVAFYQRNMSCALIDTEYILQWERLNHARLVRGKTLFHKSAYKQF